jgi:hypothetical protein
VLLVTDGFTPAQTGWITHQVFDQRLATAAYAKGYARNIPIDDRMTAVLTLRVSGDLTEAAA